MRLFIALALPQEVRDDLERLATGLSGVRWVPSDNYHLTLRFLGEVERPDARDIDDALAALRMPRFELSLAGIGSFGEGRRLRSLWVGVDRHPALTRLQAGVERAVVRAGRPRETRRFKPHVTLARCKNAAPRPDKLQKFLVERALYRSRPFTVAGFTLFSSFLSSSGAIYTPEVEYSLEPGSEAQISDPGPNGTAPHLTPGDTPSCSKDSSGTRSRPATPS